MEALDRMNSNKLPEEVRRKDLEPEDLLILAFSMLMKGEVVSMSNKGEYETRREVLGGHPRQQYSSLTLLGRGRR